MKGRKMFLLKNKSLHMVGKNKENSQEFTCYDCNLMKSGSFKTKYPSAANKHLFLHDIEVPTQSHNKLMKYAEKYGLKQKYPLAYSNLRGGTFECNAGWFDLLDHIGERLEKILCDALSGPPESSVIVKEKYGVLEIQGYLEAQNSFPAIQDIKEEAREASKHICDICGEPGKRRDLSGWLATRCGYHSSRAGWREYE